MAEKKFMTVKQVADLLSVSEYSVREWSKAGKLGGVKLPGGDWRYRPEFIENWIEKRTIKKK